MISQYPNWEQENSGLQVSFEMFIYLACLIGALYCLKLAYQSLVKVRDAKKYHNKRLSNRPMLIRLGLVAGFLMVFLGTLYANIDDYETAYDGKVAVTITEKSTAILR